MVLDLQQRTLRVGLTAILCAAVFRLCSMDLAGPIRTFLADPDTAAFLLYLETGRNVRFSPSSEAFSPDFVESPPPFLPEDREPVLPDFSGESIPQVQYMASSRPDLPALLTEPLQWDLRGEEPTVLILHTHSTESYTKGTAAYKETSAYRTLEEDYNMLSIGALTVQLLQEQGIPAIQDRTVHDYPSYNGSYSHARKSISQYLEQYPSLQLILDLHRDASEGSSGQLRTLANVDGTRSAQLMVVIGANHSGYEANLSLGLKLHAQLELQAPGITRPLQLRASRFNQDLLPGALLIEVGAAGNTRDEALLAARQLASAITDLAAGTAPAEEASG